MRFHIRLWYRDETGYKIAAETNDIQHALKIYMHYLEDTNEYAVDLLDELYGHELECDEVGSLNLVYLLDEEALDRHRYHIKDYLAQFPTE